MTHKSQSVPTETFLTEEAEIKQTTLIQEDAPKGYSGLKEERAKGKTKRTKKLYHKGLKMLKKKT